MSQSREIDSNDQSLSDEIHLKFHNTHIHITEHNARGTLNLDADGDSEIHVGSEGVEVHVSGTLESNTQAILDAVEERLAADRLVRKSKNQVSLSPPVSSETMIYGYPDKDYHLQYQNWGTISSKGHGDVSIEVQTKNNKDNVSINFYSYENKKYSPGMFSLRTQSGCDSNVVEEDMDKKCKM